MMDGGIGGGDRHCGAVGRGARRGGGRRDGRGVGDGESGRGGRGQGGGTGDGRRGRGKGRVGRRGRIGVGGIIFTARATDQSDRKQQQKEGKPSSGKIREKCFLAVIKAHGSSP